MIIYTKTGAVRATIHESSDAEVLLQISDEEYFQTRVDLSSYVNFSVGDYVTVYGQVYHIAKKPTPEKKGSNSYSWTLKFVSARDYLAGVNFSLFDNTTLNAYDADTIYCMDSVVSSGGNNWRYIYETATKGNAPAENAYWTQIFQWTNTSYTEGVFVYNLNVVYRCLTTGTFALIEGDNWTVVNTAPMWDFSTVLSPTGYAQMICDCMNAEVPTQHWVVGSCLAAMPRQLAFSNIQCLEASASIADLFETEFFVDMDGTDYRLNFNKLSYTADPQVQLAQGEGNGLTNISCQENTETKKVTRLIALGGTRNLNGTYRNGSPRLMLPDRYFIDSIYRDPTDPHNDTQTWDDIFPCMQFATEDYDTTIEYTEGAQVLYTGKSWDCVTPTTGAWNAADWVLSEGQITTVVTTVITGATTAFKFIDENLTFNPLNPAFIMADGTQPKVKFITGNLAGYEFPVTDFDTVTKQITIEAIQDSTDSNLPTIGYTFAEGDWFVFVDLYMPQSYVDKAELRLKATALAYLADHEVDQITYSCTVDALLELDLHKGEIVHLTDVNFGLDANYRIVILRRNYTKPYKYDITLSNLPYVQSRVKKIENKIKENTTYLERTGSKAFMAKSKTFRGAKEAIDMAFDPSGDYYTKKIAPLTVETTAVLTGTREQQYVLTGLEFTTQTDDPNYIAWTLGTITDSKVEDSPRTWNVPAGDSSLMVVDNNTAYYVYIKAERAIASTDSTLIFDSVAHLTKEGTEFYYFLIGTLGVVESGMRQLYTSKGFTFINGDTITTGCIQNTQGTVKLDLSGEKVHFGTDGDTRYVDLNAPAGTFKFKNITIVSSSGDESPIGVFRGAYADIQYYEGDEVTYLGGSYRAIADTIHNLPTNTTYWILAAAKGADGADGAYIEYRYNKNGSTTVPPAIDQTVIVPPGWSTTAPSIGTLEYLWMTKAKISSDGTTLITQWITPVRLSGVNGSNGTNGLQGPAMTGGDTYDSFKTYYGNQYRVDVVCDGSTYYVARTDAGTFYGQHPTNTAYWNPFGASFDSVATKVFFATLATIKNLYAERLRTGISGARIELNMGDSNSIKVYDSGGTNVINIDDTAGVEYEEGFAYQYPGVAVGSSTKSISTPNGFFTNGRGVTAFAPSSGQVARAGMVSLTSGNLSGANEWIAGVYGHASNSGYAPTYGFVSLQDYRAINSYFYGKGLKMEVTSANYMYIPNTNNYALNTYPEKTLYIDSDKTSNLNRYLPNAGTFGVGRTLIYVNGNDYDAAIYPYSGQYINGFLGSSKHISLVDTHDCCQLLAVSSTAWIITSIRGSF